MAHRARERGGARRHDRRDVGPDGRRDVPRRAAARDL